MDFYIHDETEQTKRYDHLLYAKSKITGGKVFSAKENDLFRNESLQRKIAFHKTRREHS